MLPLTLALAALATEGWPPPRVTLLPPRWEGGASTLDSLTRQRFETALSAHLTRASGTCVVTPRDLRALERRPDSSEPLCGVPPAVALQSRDAVAARFGQQGGAWTAQLTWVITDEARALAELTVARSSPNALEAALDDAVRALANTAAHPPFVLARMRGVLVESEASPCEPPLLTVDAEGEVRWSEPDPFVVRERTPSEAHNAARERAERLLAQAVLNQVLEGALAYALAQLDDPAREVIHEAAAAFDRWAKHEVLRRPKSFLRAEHSLPTEPSKEPRFANLALRGCVDLAALQAAVRRRVALLAPQGKGAVVIFAQQDALGRGLAEILRRARFGVIDTRAVVALPGMGTTAERQWIARVLAENHANAALIVGLASDLGGGASHTAGTVAVEIRVADAQGTSIGRRLFREKVSSAPDAARGVGTAWASGYPEDLEQWLLETLAAPAAKP